MLDKQHPRYQSLVMRNKLVKGIELGIVHPSGLISHGRGEAFDYLLSEKTHEFAKKAVDAAVALTLLSNYPVFSVNGNVAALIPEELRKINRECSINIEINLFHRTNERIFKIKKFLQEHGVLVINKRNSPLVDIRVIKSDRAIVCKNGIYAADTVIIPLEDGDRANALKSLGKKIIAIDLNPLSRTAKMADITIVDNICRCISIFVNRYKVLKNVPRQKLQKIAESFDNAKNLWLAEKQIRKLQ